MGCPSNCCRLASCTEPRDRRGVEAYIAMVLESVRVPPRRNRCPLRITNYVQAPELRALRPAIGVPLFKSAPELGIHWNTLARYERGELPIAEPVARLARLIVQCRRARGAGMPECGAGRGDGAVERRCRRADGGAG